MQSYFMWDSFTSGVAISSMRNDKDCQHGNDFAELEYMNITVITSNEPYGIYDGSNPLFDGHAVPKFGLKKGGVHSGHVQTGITDSFCLTEGNRKGRCEVWYSQIDFYSCTICLYVKYSGLTLISMKLH